MTFMREIVRYCYAPFMMLGLTGAAYWIVARSWSSRRDTPGPIC